MKEVLTVEEFSDFVKFMRESIGMPRRVFADAIGVNYNTIKNWEQAERLPRDVYPIINTIRTIVKTRIKNKRLIA